MLSRILDTIESCNLNFLLGSGLSSPYLKTLGQIETLLTDLEKKDLLEATKNLIRCSLYKSYFDGVISRNRAILEGDEGAKPVLDKYLDFLKQIGQILLKRNSTILGKEVNVFTTNIDVFLEQAIEKLGLECNDGFSGRFLPWFDLSNFKKAHFKRSLQYDNVSEIPTINLLKLHGSLTWRIADDDRIYFSSDLEQVTTIRRKEVNPELLLELGEATTIESLIEASSGKKPDASVRDFLEAYGGLAIVNPTKAKFMHTLLNQTHYELLRLYSNELEKENTLLIVAGFSFADEHIREITLRALNSNPTLVLYIIAYDSTSAIQLRERFLDQAVRNGNVVIIQPDVDKDGKDSFKYELSAINKKILGKILGRIGTHDEQPGTKSITA